MASDLYRIKPLEWRPYIGDDVISSTIFNDLFIRDDWCGWRFSYCVDEHYDEGSETFATCDEAKARAEQWYRERLLTALEKVDE